jgi:hypothetical protein
VGRHALLSSLALCVPKIIGNAWVLGLDGYLRIKAFWIVEISSTYKLVKSKSIHQKQ